MLDEENFYYLMTTAVATWEIALRYDNSTPIEASGSVGAPAPYTCMCMCIDRYIKIDKYTRTYITIHYAKVYR